MASFLFVGPSLLHLNIYIYIYIVKSRKKSPDLNWHLVSIPPVETWGIYDQKSTEHTKNLSTRSVAAWRVHQHESWRCSVGATYPVHFCGGTTTSACSVPSIHYFPDLKIRFAHLCGTLVISAERMVQKWKERNKEVGVSINEAPQSELLVFCLELFQECVLGIYR